MVAALGYFQLIMVYINTEAVPERCSYQKGSENMKQIYSWTATPLKVLPATWIIPKNYIQFSFPCG